MGPEPHAAKGLAPTFQHTLAFWLLTLVAGTMFVPCAQLPIDFEYTSWRHHRATVEARVQALRQQAEKNETVIEALRTDPAVNRRLLARDLGYLPPDQEAVTVFTPPADGPGRLPSLVLRGPAAGPHTEPPPVQLKPWEAHLEQRLPRGGWLPVFTEPSSRRVLLVMSAALLVTALVFFPARYCPK